MTIVAKWTGVVAGALGLLGTLGWAAEGQKVPRPKVQELDRAEKLVEEVFGKDMAKAKTPADKAKLAGEILKSAREEQDPTVRFAALQAARGLAIEALDGKLGLEIVRQIVAEYEPLEEMSTADRLAEADRLWQQTERSQGREKLAKQLEAAEAYLYLLPEATGLTKNKIERRLGELGDIASEVDIPKLLKEAWCVISFEPKRPVWPPNIRLAPDGNVAFRPGANGIAAFFDAKGRIEIKNSAQLHGERGLTLSALIMPYKFATVENEILSKDEHAQFGPRGWTLRCRGNARLEFVFGDGTKWFFLQSESPLALNRWNHVVVSLNSRLAVIYINGAKQGQNEMGFSQNDLSVQIGHRALGGLPPHPFEGMIDEIAIWTTPLSELEVKSLYKVISQGISLTVLMR